MKKRQRQYKPVTPEPYREAPTLENGSFLCPATQEGVLDTRRCDRTRAVEKHFESRMGTELQAQCSIKQEASSGHIPSADMADKFSSLGQVQEKAAWSINRVRRPKSTSIEQTETRHRQHQDPSLQNSLPTKRSSQNQESKQPQEEKVVPLHDPLEGLQGQPQIFLQTSREARIHYWATNGTWPSNEEVKEPMDRFRELVLPALAKSPSRNSLRRKRADTSTVNESVSTPTSNEQRPREQKSAPYRQPCYESQLGERGSFMDDYEGISVESKELCQKLLMSPQSPPQATLFDDDIFRSTLKLLKGRNEMRVIRDIAQLIVPSAELLAIRGSKHLNILRETVNAGWINAVPFFGPRPQPDYSLGFKREAFTKDQLEKLLPFIGCESDAHSQFAATHDMYFPFLTSEVKCGAIALDIADRQNAHSQTILQHGLFVLFRLVGRQNELHNSINGFSFSHSDVDVRIWAHLMVINGEDAEFYREPIAMFSIKKTAQTDNRWTAWTVVMNILDLWVTDHFKLVCSAIDMLPASLDFEVSEFSQTGPVDQDIASPCSGLSQQLERASLADEGELTTSKRQKRE
ncbi:hypothetical protein GQ44DRAFT_701579 [Phaeosphaeriaceae sp. PMI808]|nr:hypothetical protein GQ44DRAFT_701579 [Phaeosphaeriaceae sp. PMI808]